MKNMIKIGALLGSLLVAVGTVAEPMSEAEFKAEAKQKAMLLGKTLKQNLQQAVKQGGLAHGVTVCKDIAPAIAAQLSADGWQVGRTALKVRNPDNRPDDWEQSSLKAMVKALEQGQQPATLAKVAVSDKGEYRFMAPIMTDGLCLNCHGSNLAADVKARIQQQYPNDEATGFAAGDLRGAFTVTFKSE